MKPKGQRDQLKVQDNCSHRAYVRPMGRGKGNRQFPNIRL